MPVKLEKWQKEELVEAGQDAVQVIFGIASDLSEQAMLDLTEEEREDIARKTSDTFLREVKKVLGLPGSKSDL